MASMKHIFWYRIEYVAISPSSFTVRPRNGVITSIVMIAYVGTLPHGVGQTLVMARPPRAAS